MLLILFIFVTIGSSINADRGGQNSSGGTWETSQFSLKAENAERKTDQTAFKQKSAGGTGMSMQKTKILINKENAQQTPCQIQNCQSCKSDDENSCEQCTPGFSLDANGDSCTACENSKNINGCGSYSVRNECEIECTSCIQNYRLDNDQCQTCDSIDNCVYASDDRCTCPSCELNYRLSTSADACQACDAIDKCSVYASDDRCTESCSSCESIYTPSTNADACEVSARSIKLTSMIGNQQLRYATAKVIKCDSTEGDVWTISDGGFADDGSSLIQLKLNRLENKFLHRKAGNGEDGIVTWNTGTGNNWVVKNFDGETIQLMSNFKKDFLYCDNVDGQAKAETLEDDQVVEDRFKWTVTFEDS